MPTLKRFNNNVTPSQVSNGGEHSLFTSPRLREKGDMATVDVSCEDNDLTYS